MIPTSFRIVPPPFKLLQYPSTPGIPNGFNLKPSQPRPFRRQFQGVISVLTHFQSNQSLDILGLKCRRDLSFVETVAPLQCANIPVCHRIKADFLRMTMSCLESIDSLDIAHGQLSISLRIRQISSTSVVIFAVISLDSIFKFEIKIRKSYSPSKPGVSQVTPELAMPKPNLRAF
jgi:hypothetical protein